MDSMIDLIDLMIDLMDLIMDLMDPMMDWMDCLTKGGELGSRALYRISAPRGRRRARS